MKLTIEQSALQKGLARVVAVVAARNTIPILANVLIDAESEPDRVWITATDLDREARTAVEATIHEAGRITAPAALLSNIARNAPSGAEVAMTWDKAKDPRLTVQFGRSRFQVPVLPHTDFPVWGERKWPVTITLDVRALAAMIQRAAFASDGAEKGSSEIIQSGYLHWLDEGGPRLRLTATNKFRLAYADETAFKASKDWTGVIIPARTLTEFARALDGRAGDVALHVSEQGLQLDLDDMVISSKVVDGTYFDYGRIVPRTWNHAIKVERTLLVNALRRIMLMADDRVGGVNLDVGDGRIALSARNSDNGQAGEEIEVDYAGEPFRVSLKGRFMLDALGQTEADDVRIVLADPNSPLRLEPAEDDPEHGSCLSILTTMKG